MPRMRTLDAAIALLQELDPETAFTKHALRQMVLAGEIPSVVIGNRKRLINVDVLLEQLSNPKSVPLPSESPAGQVRKVQV